MRDLLLHNARLLHENGVTPGGLVVRDGRIAHLFSEDDPPAGLSDAATLDAGGNFLSPGMIDLHLHGAAGVDVMRADDAALVRLAEFLLAEGVTGYFATFVPADEREVVEALASVTARMAEQDDPQRPAGARLLGVHFEGPFVSRHRCGALRPRFFREYDGDRRGLEIFTGGRVSGARLMTLAPDTPNGVALARDLTRAGVRVFLGHTEADPETLDAAFEAGGRHITHFPNALAPLHHRQPGAVAWGLVRGAVTVDVIVDFQHVHPLMLRLIYQAKGAGGMALISDAIAPAGLREGEYTVWGERIRVHEGRTALAEGPSAGAIAGAVITLRQALKNFADLGIALHEAARCASAVPARVAGLDGGYGSLSVGQRADLIAFDEAFNMRLTMVGGRIQKC